MKKLIVFVIASAFFSSAFAVDEHCKIAIKSVEKSYQSDPPDIVRELSPEQVLEKLADDCPQKKPLKKAIDLRNKAVIEQQKSQQKIDDILQKTHNPNREEIHP